MKIFPKIFHWRRKWQLGGIVYNLFFMVIFTKSLCTRKSCLFEWCLGHAATLFLKHDVPVIEPLRHLQGVQETKSSSTPISMLAQRFLTGGGYHTFLPHIPVHNLPSCTVRLERVPANQAARFIWSVTTSSQTFTVIVFIWRVLNCLLHRSGSCRTVGRCKDMPWPVGIWESRVLLFTVGIWIWYSICEWVSKVLWCF